MRGGCSYRPKIITHRRFVDPQVFGPIGDRPMALFTFQKQPYTEPADADLLESVFN